MGVMGGTRHGRLPRQRTGKASDARTVDLFPRRRSSGGPDSNGSMEYHNMFTSERLISANALNYSRRGVPYAESSRLLACALAGAMIGLILSSTPLSAQDIETTLVRSAGTFDKPLPIGKRFTVTGRMLCQDTVPQSVRLDTWAVSDGVARELETHGERTRGDAHFDRWELPL